MKERYVGRAVPRKEDAELLKGQGRYTEDKGVGETGTIASPPAVINAVVDALSHLGVTDIERPATPERVWRAIRQATGGAR